ncbi:hypothetical protein C9374_007387 [Naegleria lovaniensis]|uniref:Uncharacterized protein n=1 Tax=Naegleria lovaniensis TaxID=51637 RepID=A0AA88GIJ4_NAELO|nr:uncharacterized protein C9374_007387 [Naegleria lovaniensis]KAG2379248.1 hypothetical protein C9374_007387 [Naegleria lovaniensis]
MPTNSSTESINNSSNHHSSPSSIKSTPRIHHQISATSVSPGNYRKPKKLHILNKMERERREQIERLKQSQQPIPVATTTQSATLSSKSLSESMTRLSLDSSAAASLLSFAHGNNSINSQDPDSSSPQQAKSEDKTTCHEHPFKNSSSSQQPLRPIPIHPSTFNNNTLNVKNNNNTSTHSSSIVSLSSYDSSIVKTNSSLMITPSIPKTPQSQKTKQFFKRKIISPMQNPSLVNQEDDAEDLTDISKRLAFDQKNVVTKTRPSIPQPPSLNSLTSEPPLSTPEKRLTKRMTLHKKTSVTKAPDVPCSLKFVF